MHIVDPYTDEPYSRDPRQVAAKAEAYLASTGIADTAFFAPEAEFYIFDDVRFKTAQNESFYKIDSFEAAWNTGREEEGGNLGHKIPYKGGYFPVPPVDGFADIRDEISLAAGRPRPRCRARPPRGRHRRPAGDQLPLRQAGDLRRQGHALQVRREERGPQQRQDGDLHAEAAVRRQRLGHARATSRCGRTASRCSSTRRATAACPTSPAGTSAACSSTRRRCWRSPTRR